MGTRPNYTEGFNRISIGLSILAVPVTMWLIFEDLNWVAPSKAEGLMYFGLSILAAGGVWLATRFIAWVLKGFYSSGIL